MTIPILDNKQYIYIIISTACFTHHTSATLLIQIVVKTCLFKGHLLMKEQRKDGRETFRLTVLAHEAHAKVDVILG